MTEPFDPEGVRKFDPALWRGMTERRISRRDLIRYAGTGAGAVGLAAFLAACGVSGSTGGGGKSPKPVSSEDVSKIFEGEPAGELNFANWPYYIDSANRSHPSIVQFTKETGIKVNYKPVIQGNDTFLATILPSIQAGQDTGWDIIVITNGTELAKLFKLNALTPLDLSKAPNFNQYASPSVKNPSYDPGNKFTMAWQSGFTGIGYNVKHTGREITSMQDFLDPKFNGKVGMFADNQDLPTVGMLAAGVAKPEHSTPDEWQKGADWLLKAQPLVRQYYDQGYITALQNEDTWVSMAWSGDIFQSNLEGYKDLRFVVPTEGGALWTDNMCIPSKAAHPVDAITYMDYVYKPEIAAEIADWVNYITPVPSAKDIILNDLDDPTVAKSTMVFPDEATLAKGHRYYVFKDQAEEDQWNSIFQPIYQS
jgi:spermidine/putrescine transport system substrate-binding protein